jgi:nicotinamide-nucleotide amidase
MVVELVNTGTELMLGRVLNTHQEWLCRQLADLGHVVTRQVAVPDSNQDIETAVRESLARADLVLVTGGLGPTSDDLTRERIAATLGKPLRQNAAIVAHITSFFEERKRPMPDRVLVQALVPEGGHVLPNPHGTAPGLALEVNPNPFRNGGKPAWLILLPGPPRELRPMFTDSVAPLLRKVFRQETFVCRTLRATGIGESMVEQKVGRRLEPLVQAGLDLGYCARPGQVDVRLAARGDVSGKLVSDAEGIVRAELAAFIYGDGEEDLEETVIRLLTRSRRTLALAESCTGGYIANRLTNVPGASAILLAGFVTYSNAAKQKFLGVRAESLAEHGAVSEVVAREMAEGARQQTGADYTLSVTGIAGPSGGTATKPVGTAFIGLSGPFETVVIHNVNAWDRETFKQVTAQQALHLLRNKV